MESMRYEDIFAFRTINYTCIGQTRGKYLPGNVFIMNKIEMVEAAGVEPASETTVNRELSCFFRSHLSRSECLQRTKTHSPPA